MDDVSNRAVLTQLQGMDPYAFEAFVASVWGLDGYETTVRSGSGDRGIDVEATKSFPVDQTVLIQAKRYDDGNTVGSSAVRSYATLFQQVPDADSVVIVTTSEFTREARKLAVDLNVKLVDGDDLAGIVHDHRDELDWEATTSDGPSTSAAEHSRFVNPFDFESTTSTPTRNHEFFRDCPMCGGEHAVWHVEITNDELLKCGKCHTKWRGEASSVLPGKTRWFVYRDGERGEGRLMDGWRNRA